MNRIPALALALLALAGNGPCQEPDAGPWSVAEPDLPLRDLSFEVSEGTWMSCDVHPDGREVVFDLLGDLYVVSIDGGPARCIRSGLAWEIQPRYSPDGRSISFTSDASGGDNIWIARTDGSEARPVTEERFRLLNNATWSPDGRTVVARKHFTSRRSLGAGEMWLYPVDGPHGGVQLTARKNDQQDAGEPVLDPTGRFLYWSEDVSGGSTFEYNKDPNGQIYAILRKDLETGRVRRQVEGLGGSVRPQPSPDGKLLAFVRRVRTRTVLYVQDLESGRARPIFDGLSRDAQETWAVFGVHPGFGWTPDSRSIVVSAGRKLVRIDVATGEVRPIPFTARVELRIAETLRHPVAIGGPTARIRVCRWPTVAPDGRSVVFGAVGRLWRKDLPDGAPRAITPADVLAYFPAHGPDGRLAYTTWHDTEGGRVRLVDERGEDRVLVDRPGRYRHPRFAPDGSWLVYQRLGRDSTTGSDFAADPGIYRVDAAGGQPVRVTEEGRDPSVDPTGRRILFEIDEGEDHLLVSVDTSGNDRRVLARSRYATEFELSPDGRWLAFTELWNAYLVPRPETGGPLTVSAAMKDLPIARLTRDAGQDLSFSFDSSRIDHGLASDLRMTPIDGLFRPPLGTADPEAGKAEPEATATIVDLGFELPAGAPTGQLLLTGGRLVTMKGDQVIERGAVHVDGDRIVGIHAAGDPALAALDPAIPRIDLGGRTVLPGLIDVHAHMGHGSAGILPGRNWRHLANLSFGVTTTHDPSNDTRLVFTASEMQKVGRIVAPRLTSTGTILYGADGRFKAVIDSVDDALSHIRRTAAFGAFTVKSYNQPRRDQRQQVLRAARDLGVMVVPEGGSTLQHNLNMIVDGHTTIEHALPVAELGEDVLTLFSRSGTAYTPTLVVGYGGLWGENFFYQRDQVWRNERLLAWMPRSSLDARARRRAMAPADEFHHLELARTAAELARRGTLVEVGGHGPPRRTATPRTAAGDAGERPPGHRRPPMSGATRTARSRTSRGNRIVSSPPSDSTARRLTAPLPQVSQNSTW